MKQIPIYQNRCIVGYVKLREIADIFSVDGELKPGEDDSVVVKLRSAWPAGSHFVAYSKDIAREFMTKRWRPA